MANCSLLVAARRRRSFAWFYFFVGIFTQCVMFYYFVPRLSPPVITSSLRPLQEQPYMPEKDVRPVRNYNRTITLVHVGKTGGTTFQDNTRLVCTHPKQHWMGHEAKTEKCLKKWFNKENVLSLSVKNVFHILHFTEKELQESTSFVLTIRNPVDRIISAYKYSHPANCHNKDNPETWTYGCRLKQRFAEDDALTRYAKPYEFFHSCCPTLKLVPKTAWNSSDSQCQQLALDTVQGRMGHGVCPHMWYNYDYYFRHTIEKYPEKEIFVLRTEHLWDDIVELDKLIGGNGEFEYNGWKRTYGSEQYKEEALLDAEYQDLCCLLSKEILIFESIVNQAINLNDTSKKKTIDSVYDKCGVGKSRSDWMSSCHLRLATLPNGTANGLR